MARAPRPCPTPGCPTLLAPGATCPDHAPRPWSTGTAGRGRGRSGWAWTRTRAAVLARDSYACRIGGPGCTTTATEVDHLVPLSAGGTDDPGNLRAVCAVCHRAKTAADAAHRRGP